MPLNLLPLFAVCVLVCLSEVVARGLLQPRPLSRWNAAGHISAVASLPEGARLPKLVVFDLDHTLWTPELYQLRQVPGYNTAAPPGPLPHEDIWLLDGAHSALHELATHPRWSGTAVGVASRTNKGSWAHSLLSSFMVDDKPLRHLFERKRCLGLGKGVGLPDANSDGPTSTTTSNSSSRTDKADHSLIQIYTGDKTCHFESLKKETNLEFHEMLFFDDARDGKYGNCEVVSKLGVHAAWCPRGLTKEVWAAALASYAESYERGPAFVGRIVDPPGPDWSSAAADTSTSISTSKKKKEKKGESPQLAPGTTTGTRDMKNMKVFSMNMPFASLLAHGVKTLESRNGTMFFNGCQPGEQVLLHVGQRTYPDGGVHREVLSEMGMDAVQVEALTFLPDGFARGDVVAVLELGETWLCDDVEQRSQPQIEQAVVARGHAMGKYLTRIEKVKWLKKGFKTKGSGGFWTADIPVDIIPDL